MYYRVVCRFWLTCGTLAPWFGGILPSDMHRSISLLFLIGYGAFAQTPVITSVVGAASFAAVPAAAGSLITIFGFNLVANAAMDTIAPSAPLPTTLKGVSVRIGNVSAPLQYISSQQINVQVPWEVAGAGQAALTVTVNGVTSASLDLAIAVVSPQTFGVFPAATRAYTAVRQGEYMAIYCTGLGDLATKPPASGAFSQGPSAPVKAAVTVTIGGMAATTAFAGLAPSELLGYDSVGLYEVDVLVPGNAPTGNAVPVVVTAAGIAANPILAAIAPSSPAQVLYQWTQLGANGLAAKAITGTAVCPMLKLNGTDTAMTPRAMPSLPFYPVLSCELVLPASTTSASINGAALPLLNPNATRVAIIGDTGCRLDAARSQACNDPAEWPTAITAASAAASSPDAVIQLGDLHYREAPCPAGNAGCQGSPWGFNWAAWNADFFAVMTPIFQAAPMVLLRGNHEMCSRAGEGWFRFLDTRPYTPVCNLYTDPYTVQVGPTQFFVMDSSEATDTTANPAVVDKYRRQFDLLKQVVTPNTWIMMHHPMWGFDSTGTRNLSLQTASGNSLPEGVQLALAGHIHVFQTLNFAPARTPQMIAGNGGDVLQAYAATVTDFNGRQIGNATVTGSALYKDFGFTTMDWTGDSWTAIARDVFGAAVTTCKVGGGTIQCK